MILWLNPWFSWINKSWKGSCPSFSKIWTLYLTNYASSSLIDRLWRILVMCWSGSSSVIRLSLHLKMSKWCSICLKTAIRKLMEAHSSREEDPSPLNYPYSKLFQTSLRISLGLYKWSCLIESLRLGLDSLLEALMPLKRNACKTGSGKYRRLWTPRTRTRSLYRHFIILMMMILSNSITNRSKILLADPAYKRCWPDKSLV